MPRPRAFLALAIALCAIGTRPGYAWSNEAHEIACEIAWQRLTPAAAAMVRKLRRADREPDRTFSAACGWADRVRDRNASHPHTGAYHYVNVPPGSAGIDPERDCAGEERCVTWAITYYAAQLRDTSLPLATRAEALKFVAHFIADVHQPLHVGRAADRGGNEISVDFLGEYESCARGQARDLHEVWDRSILERAGERWPEAGRRLHRAITAGDADAWLRAGVLDWANESFRLCESFVYDLPPTSRRCGRDVRRIDRAYYRRALAISRTRLQQAGVRIADALDRAARGLPLR